MPTRDPTGRPLCSRASPPPPAPRTQLIPRLAEPSHARPREGTLPNPSLPGQSRQSSQVAPASLPPGAFPDLPAGCASLGPESPRAPLTCQFPGRPTLFLARLPLDEPDTEVVMSILMGAPSLSAAPPPAAAPQVLSGSLVPRPGSTLTGRLTLSNAGLNLPMCKMGDMCGLQRPPQPRPPSLGPLPQSPAWAPDDPSCFQTSNGASLTDPSCRWGAETQRGSGTSPKATRRDPGCPSCVAARGRRVCAPPRPPTCPHICV